MISEVSRRKAVTRSTRHLSARRKSEGGPSELDGTRSYVNSVGDIKRIRDQRPTVELEYKLDHGVSSPRSPGEFDDMFDLVDGRFV